VRAPRAALTLVLATCACGWTRPDEQVLTKFFEQSRIYDTTRLAGLATVVFDPRTDGVVQRFTIVRRGADEPISPQGRRRQVTLSADVRSPRGQVQRTDLMMTLEERDGAWRVVGFK
jgi:hypothetical protein